ncbi:extracellular solute-binding protein [Parablautia intestinalis]|uniref:Extracellular solute-binding protein n=1 Tax=Parablautia intestinalis TaxID=2320100 RepID=A0A3A9AQX9_9FIRM|nr:extracellular solute-binding protein [Parablautia intestinalis]RKI93629.1 extracellular solute-binding protein [Parablautia intestinalis]
MKSKKILALLLTGAMVMSVAACGKNEQTSGGDSNAGGQEETGAQTAETESGSDSNAGGGGLTEVTYMHKLNGTEKYVGNGDINNNVYTRCYEDELGIKLNFTVAAAGDDYTQKLTMAIASNDLPDLMDLPAEEFSELANAGMLADITDSYDTYASDLLKQTIEVDGGIQLASAKVDGRLYGIPQLSAADGTCDLLWIRTDWLENLGLKAPTTMDELIEVARAFRYDDPDGNGVDDTWGIGFQKDIVTEDGASPGSFEGFFAAYGAYARAWVKDESGKVTYSGINEGMKDALAQLNQMYQDGLIDPEFGVKDTVKLSEDIAAGKVGMFYGLEGMPWGACKSNIENNPDADWQCYPIVSATSEPAKPITYVRISRYYAANANCENPEALIKIANVFQDKINSLESTEETLNTFGVDPATGINFAEYAAFAMDPAIQKCNTYYAEIKSTLEGETTVEEIHPEAARYYKVIKNFIDNGMDKGQDSLGWNYYKFIGPEGSWNTIINDYKANDKLVQSVFFGAPTPTMSTNLSALNKMQAETCVNIIMGSQPADSFDEFVSNWKSLGGDTITEEVNEWYNTTFGN